VGELLFLNEFGLLSLHQSTTQELKHWKIVMIVVCNFLFNNFVWDFFI